MKLRTLPLRFLLAIAPAFLLSSCYYDYGYCPPPAVSPGYCAPPVVVAPPAVVVRPAPVWGFGGGYWGGYHRQGWGGYGGGWHRYGHGFGYGGCY